MEKNYWQEYWENYFNFMAVYLRDLQNVYPEVDLQNEYIEVANLLEPSMPYEDYEYDDEYDEYDEEDGTDNSEQDNDPPPFMMPGGGQSSTPFASPGAGQSAAPFAAPAGGQSPTPFISPGGGQFTINNCRRMAIVRIEMRRGFNPSNFFMIVDRADRRSIQGFRIACEGSRIRFVPMAVEYRNINVIECAF
ncbi:hypothetical protein [Romboutsia lituseburensis]|uniref:Uncharacterized protein n=1 Tax=Romboutsia lituseburensis DSM 797 TaxID=1121325 RepID=A0A1G9RYI6_9FIRM|nr:hypothetical protein [Romboutsia lituseburensis]CEH32859.1 Hypothetical protein RLITU_0248 [Romboutsia lituseburensis]SDM28224.1 hypothetical protein SAMN04515677_10814 [Romboutsia lituseburensis DSM 797]